MMHEHTVLRVCNNCCKTWMCLNFSWNKAAGTANTAVFISKVPNRMEAKFQLELQWRIRTSHFSIQVYRNLNSLLGSLGRESMDSGLRI